MSIISKCGCLASLRNLDCLTKMTLFAIFLRRHQLILIVNNFLRHAKSGIISLKRAFRSPATKFSGAHVKSRFTNYIPVVCQRENRDFSGVISDESVQGIRFRKGNILVGNGTTFANFFPSEGHNANRMFAGEIHVLHDELVPNSQRDDFEPSTAYNEMRKSLSEWAGTINRKYRRGTSEATSALRNLTKLNEEQKELEGKIDSGAITSDEKREQIAERLEKIARTREKEEKTVRKAMERGTFDDERKETVEKALSQTEAATKKVTALNTKIVNAGYATKNDLPSSYSRDERKLYQRIISIIDLQVNPKQQRRCVRR